MLNVLVISSTATVDVDVGGCIEPYLGPLDLLRIERHPFLLNVFVQNIRNKRIPILDVVSDLPVG